MKKILNSSFIAALVCLVVGLTFSSCKKESEAEKAYTGRWEIKKMSLDNKIWTDITTGEAISLHSNKKVTATGKTFGSVLDVVVNAGYAAKWRADGKIIDVYATKDKQEINVWTMSEIETQTFKVTFAAEEGAENPVLYIQTQRSDI
ncbi:MAG: hypothetical protein HUK14_08160 [Muribaculaceae bacterium]|nr:hypothetical protein [Muribaculaceae bacterium]